MEKFRLEEVLRVLLIAIIASALGISLEFAWESFSAPDQKSGSSLGGLLVFLLYAWPAGSSIAFVLGLLLHLVLRSLHLPRIAYLGFFVIVGSATTWVVFPHGVRGYQFMSLATSFFSWLLYCFGPLPLWRYRFDPASDSDF